MDIFSGPDDAISRVVFRRPAAELGVHVLSYCEYLDRAPVPTWRQQVPSMGVALVVGFDAPLRIVHAHGRDLSAISFIAGPHDSYAETLSRGCQRGIQVDLTPIGARMLLGVPLHELANRAVGLEDVLGARAQLLTEALDPTATRKERFGRLDALLADWLADARPVPDWISWAWQRLNQTGGRLTVAALADELDLSRQHLSTRFGQEVGLSPKVVARLVRFQDALRLLDQSDAPPLSAVAHRCGYYDQAHFNREFRSLTGSTPTGYLSRRTLVDSNTTFVQDSLGDGTYDATRDPIEESSWQKTHPAPFRTSSPRSSTTTPPQPSNG